MTIIAYRDGIMAADSHIQRDGIRVGTAPKIARSSDGTIGGSSGITAICYRFRQWVAAGAEGKFVPDAATGEFGGFIVRPDGSLFIIDSKGECFPIACEYHAEGSGQDVALGAMAFGATAEQAVEIAIRLDPGCGGPIQVERLNPR